MTKKLFTFVFVLLFTPSLAYSYMLLPILEVYDGDTIKTDLGTWRLPEPLNKVSIRIKGIDTPEMPAKSYKDTGRLNRAKCIKEAELALLAKKFIELHIEHSNSKRMKISDFKWGKYGSRIISTVEINGVDIGQALIDAKLAVPYDGGTKTKDWCE